MIITVIGFVVCHRLVGTCHFYPLRNATMCRIYDSMQNVFKYQVERPCCVCLCQLQELEKFTYLKNLKTKNKKRTKTLTV